MKMKTSAAGKFLWDSRWDFKFLTSHFQQVGYFSMCADEMRRASSRVYSSMCHCLLSVRGSAVEKWEKLTLNISSCSRQLNTHLWISVCVCVCPECLTTLKSKLWLIPSAQQLHYRVCGEGDRSRFRSAAGRHGSRLIPLLHLFTSPDYLWCPPSPHPRPFTPSPYPSRSLAE